MASLTVTHLVRQYERGNLTGAELLHLLIEEVVPVETGEAAFNQKHAADPAEPYLGMSRDEIDRHWHLEPAESTRRLAAAAPITPTEKGLQLAIEVIAYPDRQVQVATSQISGRPGKRTIVQAGNRSLMFNAIREAKDAVDLILDRLDEAAQQVREDK